MSVVKEYKKQASFRNWKSYINTLPLSEKDMVLDLGCSIGSMSKLLTERTDKVIGVDNNADLLKEASKINSDTKIKYINCDINNLDLAKLPMVDGIWCSFVAAYFPNFGPVLQSWQKVLKPGGWLALVEMSGLFDHEPLSETTASIFKDYYSQQRQRNIYDFEMGTRLKSFLEQAGLKIIHEEDKQDAELSFSGPASQRIIESWTSRFNRMYKFREHLGESSFQEIKQEFISCLKDKNHMSKTVVKYLIAVKPCT